MAEEAQKTRLDGAEIQEERIKLLFAHAPLAIIISPMAAAALSMAIWDVVDHRSAIIWVVAVGLVAVKRMGLWVAYKTHPAALAMRRWERWFTSTVLLTGATWGIGGWLLLPEELAYRAIIFFFLMGMASGAMVVYGIHGTGVLLTILALMIPTTVDFLLQDSLPQQLMGMAVVLYLITANRSLRITSRFVERYHSLSYDLRTAKEHAETLARTDFLTGMNNRRSFYDLCESPFKLARRHGQDLSIMLIDFDQFKKINDAHGHAIGDAVLRALARIVSETCRDSDVAGRVGGDEFAILLPHTGAQSAGELAERLRLRMEKAVVHFDESDVTFTASFGVAQMAPECESLEALVATADSAMYTAKQKGRNRVFVVAPGVTEDAAY